MLPLGKDSFWAMSNLAMAGDLASCESCVEHFYFQSQRNARAFLEACAEGGLVEKISLLDLLGDFEPRSPLAPRQIWYDQAIYISAPEFRRANATNARKRIENTKKAVYAAFNLYFERLGGNDSAINSAYGDIVEMGILRHAETARQRADVNLSGVAKLRLILDAFRKESKESEPDLSKVLIEKKASERTVDFVSQYMGRPNSISAVSDRTDELVDFVDEFLREGCIPRQYSRETFGPSLSGYQARWLSVVLELAILIHRRYVSDGAANEARVFAEHFGETIFQLSSGAPEGRFKEALDFAYRRWDATLQPLAA
ncbi:MAG: hypothetical protein E6J34_00080 [Chloroflexi bacterium]|nr:MAG: hypothetical protein E6J34_00080 [Chloroflexota bacterium]